MDWHSAVVLVLIATAVFFALRHLRRHPASCGGDCGSCGKNCRKRDQE